MRAIKNVTSSWNWPNLSASNCCTCPPTRPTSISSNACGNSSRRIVCTRPITTTLRSSNRPSHPVSLKLKPHTGPPSTPCFPTASRPSKNQKLCHGRVYPIVGAESARQLDGATTGFPHDGRPPAGHRAQHRGQSRENLQLTVQPDRVFGELLEVGQRASQVTDRLLHSATLRGARAGRLPTSRGLEAIASAGKVVGEQFREIFHGCRVLVDQRLRDPSVIYSPRRFQQQIVRGIANERVLEGVDGRCARQPQQQSRLDHRVELSPHGFLG